MLRQLWEFLASNPIILIIVLGYLASMAGNVMTRAARRAQEQQAADRQRAARQRRLDSATPEVTRSEPVVEERPPQRSPEDVAEEIRRMMGLEPERREVQVEVVEQVAVPEPEPAVEERRSHGGDLAAELERKERERAVRFDERLDKRRAELDARSAALDAKASATRFRHLPERHSQLEQGVVPGQRKKRMRSKSALFDPSDPQRAIVALEVLGPPRAMRGWDA